MTYDGRHIAIIAPPTAGHINPLAALGTALAVNGVRVTFVHMAEVAFLIPRSTVGFADLGHDDDRPRKLADYYRKLAQPSGVIGLPRMICGTAAISGLLLRALPTALRQLEVDAVIADSAEPAGALVARHLGLPFVVSHGFAPVKAISTTGLWDDKGIKRASLSIRSDVSTHRPK